MKTAFSEPEIVTRKGKPVSVILPIKTYEQMLEKLGDAADIRRRFKRSLAHLPGDYLPLATRWAVWDSRSLPAKRLAISGADAIETVRQLTG